MKAGCCPAAMAGDGRSEIQDSPCAYSPPRSRLIHALKQRRTGYVQEHELCVLRVSGAVLEPASKGSQGSGRTGPLKLCHLLLIARVCRFGHFDTASTRPKYATKVRPLRLLNQNGELKPSDPARVKSSCAGTTIPCDRECRHLRPCGGQPRFLSYRRRVRNQPT
jgi:hypothetical protein